jgi:leader peptidase (prepilin peptidase) / N-methyltransferase
MGRSVMSGRSACDACGHELSPVELIPIVSASFQRGKCRHCGAPIDRRHLVIELAAAVVGGIAFGIAPGLAGLAGAVFGWMLIALIALDTAHYWLPDKLTQPLLISGLGAGLVGIDPSFPDRLWGGAGGYLSLAAIAFVYKRARGRDGLGGGDPKLLGAIGAWLGWQYLPMVLLLASGVGLLYVLFQTLRGKPMTATDRLPLGALMALAAFPLWIYVTIRF